MNTKTKLKKLKKQVKGITLVALVVTIIVLLILAGVAISLTIGSNGIFTRAQNAVKIYEGASRDEEDESNKATNFLDKYINGDSEEDDSFEGYTKIFDQNGLKSIEDNPSSKYVLAEDIEISDFEPIDNFTGTLEGNGKTITVNSIQESECTIPDYEGVPIVGIFAQASGNINNINIKFSDTFEVGTSGLAAGGLVAIASDGLTLTNCSSSGKLEVTGSMSYVGGLVGVVIGEQNELSKLSNEATISASDSSIVGGVVGGIMDSDTYKVNITKSYNKGSITSAEMVGGIIGLVFNSEISNCYNSGEVTNGEDSSTNTAGIGFGNGDASSMKIINCYNTGIIDGGTGYAISSYESTNGTYEGCKFKSGTGIVRGETDGIKVGDISQENLDNLVK